MPREARLAVNDAGALTFFSRRPTFDVVGLTTASEGPHWVAGPGSCFEHYERLTPQERPTHFVVYPEWLALDALLGAELAERTVNSTILGGPTMRAYEADWSLLGSASRPSEARWTEAPVLDALDVAISRANARTATRSATPSARITISPYTEASPTAPARVARKSSSVCEWRAAASW